jgi:hypothetical protein
MAKVPIRASKIPPNTHSLCVNDFPKKRLFATNNREIPMSNVSVMPGKLYSGLVAL